MLNLLITGANGQVGWELARQARARQFAAAPLTRTELDITSGTAIAAAFRTHHPGLVINAAAYTAVDRAETEPGQAQAVNATGPRLLAQACQAAGIPLFHISTDYVFDGTKAGPYREEDPVCPLGAYGASKLGGEEAVRATLARHLILRTSWVFSAHGHNFVKTMLRLGMEREELRIVDDQTGCPTPAAAIAGTILDLARRFAETRDLPWGTYHYGGAPPVTWFGFAQAIFQAAEKHMGRKPPRLLPITTAQFPTPAKRPANSVFDCSCLEGALGIPQPSWKEGLAAVIKELAAG